MDESRYKYTEAHPFAREIRAMPRTLWPPPT
jgi:hypothetical protein